MCGRFTSLVPPEVLAEHFSAVLSDDPELQLFRADFNVAPSMAVLAVASTRAGGRRIGTLQWGLVPSWTQIPKGTGHVNARAETISEKPSFRDSFRRRRCLIPMSGYYEWRTVEAQEEHSEEDSSRTTPRKRAYYVSRKDGGPLAVAGLWSVWRPSADAMSSGLVERKTCCVVTTASAGEIAEIHDRMPVILDEAEWAIWLGEESPDESSEQRLLEVVGAKRSDSALEIVEVGTLVNSVRNNGPELIAPIH